MIPYYADDYVTIYHGDCREIMPGLAVCDLLLTDPPYGMGRDGKPPSTSGHGGHKGYNFLGWDSSPPTLECFALMLSRASSAIVWGGNYFPWLPASSGWLVWDKGQRIDQADGELAWTSFNRALRIKTINRIELMHDGAEHPTQKPLALMAWCLSLAPDARTIFDPFMGSGTTLRAAKDLGRKAIGIEMQERYCEIAARRCSQEVLDLAPRMANARTHL